MAYFEICVFILLLFCFVCFFLLLLPLMANKVVCVHRRLHHSVNGSYWISYQSPFLRYLTLSNIVTRLRYSTVIRGRFCRIEVNGPL